MVTEEGITAGHTRYASRGNIERNYLHFFFFPCCHPRPQAHCKHESTMVAGANRFLRSFCLIPCVFVSPFGHAIGPLASHLPIATWVFLNRCRWWREEAPKVGFCERVNRPVQTRQRKSGHAAQSIPHHLSLKSHLCSVWFPITLLRFIEKNADHGHHVIDLRCSAYSDSIRRRPSSISRRTNNRPEWKRHRKSDRRQRFCLCAGRTS